MCPLLFSKRKYILHCNSKSFINIDQTVLRQNTIPALDIPGATTLDSLHFKYDLESAKPNSLNKQLNLFYKQYSPFGLARSPRGYVLAGLKMRLRLHKTLLGTNYDGKIITRLTDKYK